MSKSTSIADTTRMSYAGLFVLRHLVEEDAEYLVELRHDEEMLEPIFAWLLKNGYVAVSERNTYAITTTGRSIVQKAEERFQTFLEDFDIYCAVDLEAGEFAFASYHHFEDNADWQEFLEQDRWDDLRIALAEYANLDIVEIVFMTMVRDHQVGFDEDGWSYDLLLGQIWETIASILDDSIRLQSLGFADGNDIISAEQVAEDILVEGRDLLNHLRLDA